jgi:hypothetical protein
MSFRVGKAREASAERLQSLVTRWQDLAWAPHVKGPEQRNGWAEHLKRVAKDHELREAEQKA